MSVAPKLFSIAAFYKSNKPEDGFSFTIDEQPDAFARALDVIYARFKALPVEKQQAYLDDTPRQLVLMKSLIAGREGERVAATSTDLLIGMSVIFILEKLARISSDEFNGMQYTTMAEVDAYRSLLKGGSQPGVFIMNYAHDEDCSKLNGGICNCKADVIVKQGRAAA